MDNSFLNPLVDRGFEIPMTASTHQFNFTFMI